MLLLSFEGWPSASLVFIITQGSALCCHPMLLLSSFVTLAIWCCSCHLMRFLHLSSGVALVIWCYSHHLMLLLPFEGWPTASLFFLITQGPALCCHPTLLLSSSITSVIWSCSCHLIIVLSLDFTFVLWRLAFGQPSSYNHTGLRLVLSSHAALVIFCYSCYLMLLLSSDIWCCYCHLVLLLSSGVTLVIWCCSCLLKAGLRPASFV